MRNLHDGDKDKVMLDSNWSSPVVNPFNMFSSGSIQEWPKVLRLGSRRVRIHVEGGCGKIIQLAFSFGSLSDTNISA